MWLEFRRVLFRSDTERDPYRKILVRRYVKNDFAQWIYNDMNYSPRTYGRKRDEALYIFAQHLERYRKKYNAQKLIPILMARKWPIFDQKTPIFDQKTPIFDR